MSKILKNDSGSNIDISDTGITINNGTQYTIPPNDYLLWAASSDAVTFIGAGDLVVNDGSVDLSISDGVDLIKGIFPTTLDINSNRDNPLIVKSNNTDTFGRARVSEVNTIFDYNFSNIIDKELYWHEKLENGATSNHVAGDAQYELLVTNTIGSKATLQSRRHMEYYTGKSHIAYFTGNPQSIQAGIRKRLGLFTGNTGYFFQLDGTGGHIVIRNGGVDVAISQADFNGDKVDGSGSSGITVDSSKQQLFFIEISWLGSGMIRFGYVINGINIIIHTYYSGNTLDTPHVMTAVLPFRIEVECVGVATSSDKVQMTCFSYMFEGNAQVGERLRGWDSGVSSLTINTTEQAIFGIRVNPIYGESAIKFLDGKITLVSGNSEVRWRLLHNPVLTSPAWSTELNSIAQTLTNPGSVSYTGGFKAASGYLNVGASSAIDLSKTDLVLGHDIDDVFDTFIIVARTLSSNSKAVIAIDWEEFS